MMVRFRLPLLFSALVILALAYTGCDIKEPVAPSYDMDLAVPLLDRDYTIKSMIEKDTSNLRFGPGSSIINYVDDQEIEATSVEDNMKFEVSNSVSEFVLGNVTVDPGQVEDVIDVTRWANVVPGNVQIFDPVNNVGVSEDLPKFDEFDVATFEAGSLQLFISNKNGPVVVVLNRIIIRNQSNDQPVFVRLTPLTLQPNSDTTLSFDCAGVTLESGLRAEVYFTSPGSLGIPVPIPIDASTKLVANFSGMVISEATGRLKSQRVIENGSLIVDDTTRFSEVIIKRGGLSLQIANPLALAVNMTITLENLLRPNGQPYSTTVRVDANSNKLYQIANLENFRLVSPTPALTQNIYYRAEAVSDAANVPVTVKKTDKFVISMFVDDVRLTEFKGIIKPTYFSKDATEIDLNLKDMEKFFTFQQINLQDAQIILHMKQTTDFDVKFKGRISGTNPNNQTAHLDIPETLIKPDMDNIVVLPPASVSAFFSAYSGKFPPTLSVSGGVTVNPNYLTSAVGEIWDTNTVSGWAEIVIPMHIGIKDGVYSDTSETEISDDDSSNIAKGRGAQMTFVIENGIAGQVEFTGKLLDKNRQFLLDMPPAGSGAPMLVHGAPVDANGRVTGTVRDSLIYNFSEADFSKIAKARYFVSNIRINTSAANNAPVQFFTTDKIRVRAYGRIKYNVSPEND